MSKRSIRFTCYLVAVLAAITATTLINYARDEDKNPPAELKLDLNEIERNDRTSYAPTIEKVAPSVVNIYSTKIVERNQNSRFFGPRDFFGIPGPRSQEPRKERQQGLGSGVIVSSDGYIITNNHVIADADEIKVALRKKKEYDAKLVGTDPKTDVAILKIDAKNLPVATIADSDKVKVGDIVFAIGNPFGVGQTVTQGIVSARARSLRMLAYEDFIQTDAAINPGNSGGALIDAKGRLIGINTAILSRSGASNGIGFAIPTNLMRQIMKQLIEEGKVSRGFLGVTIQDVTPELKEAFDLKTNKGAIVNSVVEGGAAEAAGIEAGDVIVEFNGEPVKDVRTLRFAVAGTPPGEDVTVIVIRDGERKELKAKLKEMADSPAVAGFGSRNGADELDGLTVKTLTDTDRQRLGIPDRVNGLLVTQVAPDSDAAKKGIVPGVVIMKVNNKNVKTMADAESALKLKKNSALLYVWDQGQMKFIVIDK